METQEFLTPAIIGLIALAGLGLVLKLLGLAVKMILGVLIVVAIAGAAYVYFTGEPLPTP